MRRFFFTMLFGLLLCGVYAQKENASIGRYWVQFSDKNDSPYSLDNPEAYLSERALQRRANQGIAIDEYDLPVNPAYLEMVKMCGAVIINPSKWLNGTTVEVPNPQVLVALTGQSFVTEVFMIAPPDSKCGAKDKSYTKNESYEPLDVETRRNKGFYGEGLTQIEQLNGTVLHDQGYMGEGMVIAVLDGGFSGADTHSLFDNMREEGRLLGTRNFVIPGSSVYTQSTHGTSCLSTMAAYIPNYFVGTAPKASYYLIHTEDSRSENIIEEYNWVSGAEYADSLGVDICTTSLGYVDFDLTQWNHPYAHLDGNTAPISRGAVIACSRGMICLNAAGNSGSDPNPYISVPSDVQEVITVGAVDAYGDRAYFSSIGPTADGRIKPDVMAMGQGTTVADGSGGIYYGSGTSFSTPVLAGMVACLWQANPWATPAQIREALLNCADNANNPNSEYGYGIPNFQDAMLCLGTPEVIEPAEEIVLVYPNPFGDDVNVRLLEGSKANVMVCDFYGRQLYSCSFNGLNHTSLERELKSLAAGVYFLNVTSEYGRQVIKVVKY